MKHTTKFRHERETRESEQRKARRRLPYNLLKDVIAKLFHDRFDLCALRSAGKESRQHVHFILFRGGSAGTAAPLLFPARQQLKLGKFGNIGKICTLGEEGVGWGDTAVDEAKNGQHSVVFKVRREHCVARVRERRRDKNEEMQKIKEHSLEHSERILNRTHTHNQSE